MSNYLLEDCLKVASDSPYDRVGVLIYASHKRYGGGYLNHSAAQEEWCFNRTDLPRQKPPRNFYPMAHKDSGGFSLRATLRKPYKRRELTFIFVPAPVWGVLKSEDVLRARAAHIFRLAHEAQVEHLVLGGWGCGVFGCPVPLTARVLKGHATDAFKRVDYAFLDRRLMRQFEDA